MATVFAGLRSTNDYSTDERPTSFREMILRLKPNGGAPITAMTSLFKTEGLDDPQFSWFEEESYVPRCITTGALSTSSTDVTIQASGTTGTKGDGLSFVVGDLLMVEKAITAGATSNEIVRVTAVTSATAFSVSRAASGSTAAAIPTASFLLKIGNVFAEGEVSPTVTTRNPSKLTNYAQIFKTAYRITNTAKKAKTRTGDPLKNDKARKSFDHAAALEFSTIFGRRSETLSGTTNGEPERTTGGLLDPNIGLTNYVFATSPTEAAFLDALEPLFKNTTESVGDERIGYCGNGFLNALNKKLAATSSTRINYDGILDMRGMKLQKYVFPFGTIAFKTHPLLTQNTLYTNSMLVLAPTLVRQRDFRATVTQDNIQANDADEQKGQWLTEMGIEIQHRSLMGHFHITDVTQ